MSDKSPTLPREMAGLLRLGLPLVGSSVAGFLIHTVELVMLGWYSVLSLAAATIATSLWFVVFILGAGFGNAVLPMAAGAIAAGDTVRARRVTRMAFWLSLAYSIAIIPPFWYSEAVLLAIGQTPEVAAEGQRFLRWAVWGMFPALIANALRAYLGAWQLTAVQLWITLAGLGLSALLGYGLIFGNFGLPEMGIAGAGLAAVALQTATAVALAVYAVWRLPEARLFQRIWKPDWAAMGDVFRLGLPIGVTSVSEGGLFTASAVMMGWIGATQLAAHGIALQLVALTFMFHVGMSQAATIRAGGAFGLHDEAALRRVGKAAIVLAFVFGVLVIIAFVTVPRPLIGIFIDPDEAQRPVLLALGASLLIYAAVFQFFDSAQIVALSLLRGVQDTAVPMALAAFAYWAVGVPASYLLAFRAGLGAGGLWLGLLVGLAVAAGLLMWRFWGRSVRIGLRAPAASAAA